jgi:hypothetical protein
MISVGTRGRDGRCGAEEEEEGLEEVGGGGETLAGVLCGVGVVPALNGKTNHIVSQKKKLLLLSEFTCGVTDSICWLYMYIPSLPLATRCWLLLPLVFFFSFPPALLLNLPRRRLDSQFILYEYDGSESKCSVPDFLTNIVEREIPNVNRKKLFYLSSRRSSSNSYSAII